MCVCARGGEEGSGYILALGVLFLEYLALPYTASKVTEPRNLVAPSRLTPVRVRVLSVHFDNYHISLKIAKLHAC